jgi:hypothetical protein
MEKIKTTPQLAQQIIEQGNRKIVIDNGDVVKWINLNNRTLFAEKNNRGSTHDLENVNLFILN